MARKTKEDALATRAQLLDAAEHVFCQIGVARSSLHEIAEAAGLTRGAIYWHFNNKAELLTALWERVVLPIRQAFDEGQRTEPNPLHRIRHNACWLGEHIEHDPHVRALMMILLLRCEYVAELEPARLRFLQEREYCFAQVQESFKQAISTGELPESLNTEQAAIGLLALVDGLCFHWLIEPSRFPIAEHTRASVDAYLRGLGASLSFLNKNT